MKKVLIVTYYWPPAGGPGVQRWLKFVKYLPENGIDPIVYAPKNPHYPLKDASLEAEIPSGLKVLKKGIVEPYAFAGLLSKKDTETISSGIIPKEQKQGFLQKLMLFIRGNFFIPDARKFWIKPSVKYLSEYLKEHEIDTIITTGPPHSMHLIGLQLKKETGVKWIADFRDPWTQIGYHSKLKLLSRSRKKHEELEKMVLQTAEKIITTSFTTREEFASKTDRPIEVITNGYDTEQVDKLPMDKKFSLSHIGSLLSGRNPENLWQALSELICENEDFARVFQLKLVGAVGEPVLESIKKAGLKDWLVLKNYVSHLEALQLQRSAQLLLLIEIDSEETRGIIPGKLFEYMVSERPILAVGPEKADIQKIIQETNTGSYFLYSQKGQIKAFLQEKYELFKKRELRSFPIGLQQYSRRALAKKLANQIKQL
ncbi:glycosyltransferase family 4 protein [Salinimicrobium sediminilitoris]|uniref:glycosyltransferase family 4 protein n=1 Tax=Salinimicrobium sediminilitoris TaxID=2876715 RepID=UPI001E2966A3|nr:glycosyltransferase family 4 protein [Salinimicrobium sediminilitoris]MCC8360237.1 glycosyltransferase family 4 protein [Salinimicrobium sediminilitoris]